MKYEYVDGRWKTLWRLWQSTMSISKLMTLCFLHWFSRFLNFENLFNLFMWQTNEFFVWKTNEEWSRPFEFRESNVNHFTYLFIRHELRIGRRSLDYKFITKTTRSYHLFFYRKSMLFVHPTIVPTKNEFEIKKFRFEADNGEFRCNIVSIKG